MELNIYQHEKLISKASILIGWQKLRVIFCGEGLINIFGFLCRCSHLVKRFFGSNIYAPVHCSNSAHFTKGSKVPKFEYNVLLRNLDRQQVAYIPNYFLQY